MSITLPKYNLKGDKVGELKTDSILFSEKINKGVVHEIYTVASANQRQGTAQAKTRGEVSGGGKKPWKQKGTGRARHGSIRSPIWVGGGVVFGPRADKNYKRKINKKAARKALRMVLTDRAANNHLFVVDNWDTAGKTKLFAEFIKAMKISGRSALVITNGKEESVYRAARNIARVDVLPSNELNIVELMEHQYFIVTPDTLGALEKLFVK